MGADEIGSVVRGDEFDCDQRGRDGFVGDGHGGGGDDAAVRYDRLIGALIGYLDTLERGALFETVAQAFGAAYAEVGGELFDCVHLSFREPAALSGGVGEGGEDTLRRFGEAALDDEGAVNG